jgi:hypothetical protein
LIEVNFLFAKEIQVLLAKVEVKVADSDRFGCIPIQIRTSGSESQLLKCIKQVEEELTAAEVLAKLEEAWLNEKQSPELLEPKMEVINADSDLSWLILIPVLTLG